MRTLKVAGRRLHAGEREAQRQRQRQRQSCRWLAGGCGWLAGGCTQVRP
jgi:hypothetical protein